MAGLFLIHQIPVRLWKAQKPPDSTQVLPESPVLRAGTLFPAKQLAQPSLVEGTRFDYTFCFAEGIFTTITLNSNNICLSCFVHYPLKCHYRDYLPFLGNLCHFNRGTWSTEWDVKQLTPCPCLFYDCKVYFTVNNYHHKASQVHWECVKERVKWWEIRKIWLSLLD